VLVASRCWLAAALADAGQEPLALRAYQFALRHELWDDEGEHPQRQIERLQYRLGQAGRAPAPVAGTQGNPP